MNFDDAQQIADAVLYEGYLLYPYRQTAVKNQQRWTFGGIYPAMYSNAQRGADACMTRTECLIAGGEDAAVTVRVRFLHLTDRTVGAFAQAVPAQDRDSEHPFALVDALTVGDQVFRSWQEAVERAIDAIDLPLRDLAAAPVHVPISFPASRVIEPLHDAANNAVGVLIRTQKAVEGTITIAATRVREDLYTLTIQIENVTPLAVIGVPSRDDALPQTFISTHTILGVRGGAFVSLIDPPAAMREVAAGCQNIGTWPVMVGDEGDGSLMLSSPIILYDYPQIAPESATNLFDGTEIDEILMLRIMTLTDDEKREIQQSDLRGRDVLTRTEAIPPEQFMKLHGVIRGLRPLDGDGE